MNEELISKLRDEFLPVLNEAGLDLVKLTLRQQGRVWGVEVFVDKPAGGISLAACAGLNKRFLGMIENARWLGEEFTIEVSSPGLDWPLTTAKDFARVLNRPLKIFLKEPLEGKSECEGVLLEVRAQEIVLEILGQKKHSKRDAPAIAEIPLDKISKGIQLL